VVGDGLVLTNAHLLEGVPLGGGKADQEFWPVVVDRLGRRHEATYLARDARSDLALLRLDDAPGDLTVLPLADPGLLPPGSRVVALSRAGGTELDLFAGVLAFAAGPMTLREAKLEAHEVLISDARFHASLDGGPLLDARGQVVGIHNSSHISSRPPGFDAAEDEPAKVESTDYAVVVSAAVARAAFADHLGATPSAPLEAPVPSPAVDAIAAVAPGLVTVTSGDEPPPTHPELGDPHALRVPAHLGSGGVLDAGGLIVTARSIFEQDDDDARVRLATGEVVPASVLHRRGDLVLLQCDLPEGRTLTAADTSRAAAPAQGEPIQVVGRPFGGANTLSSGVLSSTEREGRVQVASWVHPGHHGGAVVDAQGRLLGVAVEVPAGEHGVTEESYLGFAVPVQRVRESFEEHWAPAAPEPLEAPPGAVRDVVATTHGALVNVIVSRAAPKKAGGFDPFGGDDAGDTFLPLGQGSGVIIDGGGLALTNWHVVDAALAADGSQAPDHRVTVTTQDGRSLVAQVLSTSRDDDLGLIRIEVPEGERLHTVELGRSSFLELGDPVVAIGNPLGLANSVSTGVVSALGKTVQIQGRARAYSGMIQTDAAINPGNSGGALLDLQGRLIGINSAGRTGAGLAISVDRAREVFRDKLLSVERLRSTYLGLKVRVRADGVFAHEVDSAGPAAAAGVEVGDRLLKLAGDVLESEVAFAQACLRLEPWAEVSLVVLRDDGEHVLRLSPVSFAAYRALGQSGLLVEPVDYAVEGALVREASVALHRAYTGDPQARPQVLMAGALRVTRVVPHDPESDLGVAPGDLVLGMTVVTRGSAFDSYELLRFQDLADLGAALDPRAAEEETVECWVMTGEAVRTVELDLRRPR